MFDYKLFVTKKSYALFSIKKWWLYVSITLWFFFIKTINVLMKSWKIVYIIRFDDRSIKYSGYFNLRGKKCALQSYLKPRISFEINGVPFDVAHTLCGELCRVPALMLAASSRDRQLASAVHFSRWVQVGKKIYVKTKTAGVGSLLGIKTFPD